MLESTLFILLIALIADWFFGEPEILWSRLPHPIIAFGKAIKMADERFNLETYDDDERYRYGAFCITGLILFSILVGLFLHWLFLRLGVIGFALEVMIVFILIAQKSLKDHVLAVATGLREEGLEGGRKAVSMIVGRNPDNLDKASIIRASIESLAENFSDGVVAPAFWYGVFGLPGIFAYKMINTADSMIGYRSDKYRDFGKVAAQIDDLVNWLPARLSVILIAIGALFERGNSSARNALNVALRDGGLHSSPNAGWPEAAMAGAANIALGGPRQYDGGTVQQVFINGSGRRDLDVIEIDLTISIFEKSCFALMGIIGLVLILSVIF